VVVLGVLADARGELGTSEIARRAGISASTCSRLLATLAGQGLVRHLAATGRYRLGIGLVRLANAVPEARDIRSLARPHLAELAARTSETATLSVPGEHEAITLDFVHSARTVRSVAEIGRPSAAHATAVGKVYLACGGTLRPGRLTAYTPRTVTSRPALAAAAAAIRVRGWAQAAGEREEGLNAIAAPVLDPAGGLAAILGVQGPAVRFADREMRDAAAVLVRHAGLLAALL
jgi:IclR family acetate operon transcriptional repressor